MKTFEEWLHDNEDRLAEMYAETGMDQEGDFEKNREEYEQEEYTRYCRMERIGAMVGAYTGHATLKDERMTADDTLRWMLIDLRHYADFWNVDWNEENISAYQLYLQERDD